MFRLNLQPIDGLIVSTLVDEFVDYSVGANGSADKLKHCILRVAEDEVVGVKVCEVFTTDTARKLYIILVLQRLNGNDERKLTVGM